MRGVSNGKPENYFEANDQAVRERLIAIGRLFIGASKTDLALDRVLRIPMPDRRRDIPNWEKRIPNYVLRARINVLSPAEQFAAAQNKNK